MVRIVKVHLPPDEIRDLTHDPGSYMNSFPNNNPDNWKARNRPPEPTEKDKPDRK